MKAIANEDDSELYFSPPELLLDVPYSIGCFTGSPGNAVTFDSFTDKNPASCILGCLSKGEDYRFAGVLKISTLSTDITKNLLNFNFM